MVGEHITHVNRIECYLLVKHFQGTGEAILLEIKSVSERGSERIWLGFVVQDIISGELAALLEGDEVQIWVSSSSRSLQNLVAVYSR